LPGRNPKSPSLNRVGIFKNEFMKLSVDLTRFESVSATSEQKLIGGFSASFSTDLTDNVGDEGSNNCLGGNCKMGCGIDQNLRCNTAAGCM
jgi:hypothetical protein